MSEFPQSTDRVAKLPLLAALFAIFGIGDSAYLTYHHYTAEPVPCSIVSGCEQVLTSQWATLGEFLPFDAPALAEVPLAALGMAAYAIALVFALLSLRGSRKPWFIYGLHVCVMALFSGFLIYLQAYRIEAFCQFCLLSAATTLTLFVIAVISRFWKVG